MPCPGAAPASIVEKIRELEALANRQERHVKELKAMLAPLDLPRPEDVVARIRDLGALFDKSPKDAREALKHLLDDGIQLHPLQDGRYRARSMQAQIDKGVTAINTDDPGILTDLLGR